MIDKSVFSFARQKYSHIVFLKVLFMQKEAECSGQYFITADGVKIPFVELVKEYSPKGSEKVYCFKANVTKEGILFNEEFFSGPSAAAREAKKSIGVTGSSAATNGWLFWTYFDSERGGLTPLDALRK